MTTPYPMAEGNVPNVDTTQMIEVDRAMLEDYKIELIQMMENAGRTLADVARRRFLNGDPRGKHVIVLAGTGGNGGGALVAARRLHNYGANVHVIITAPAENFTPIPAHQLDVVTRMGISVEVAGDSLPDLAADVILDGVIGYSLKGDPRGTAALMINWANDHEAPVLSLDVPSGLDTADGLPRNPAIRATATMTLALPKVGLFTKAATPIVGELYLADISVPPQLYERFLDFEVGPIFGQSDIIRIK